MTNADRMKQLRKRRGLTANQTAKLFGVCQTVIEDIEQRGLHSKSPVWEFAITFAGRNFRQQGNRHNER